MTTSDVEAVAGHVNQAREFLAKSREYLTRSDLHQASEKGWGTAIHMVKAVAIASATSPWPQALAARSRWPSCSPAP